MGIRTASEYVRFYLDLNMQGSIGLLSFVNNEKMILKHKLDNKNIPKEPILHGLKILDDLTGEIQSLGESQVLEKYSK